MPTVNPSMLVDSALKGLTTNPNFLKLSPEAQAAIRQQVASGGGLGGLRNKPELQAALSEARQAGLLDNSPLWQDILKGVGIAGGVALAGPVLGALTGGAPAVTPAVTSGAAGPLAADEVFTAGPVAGAGLSGVDLAGMGAAAGGGSLLHSLLPSIIGAGSSVAGTAIASHANTEAAKIAAAQADKALAVQQQQYALQREDTAPYRALGQGAVNNLGFLSGIDTTSNLKALSSIEPTVNPPPSTAVAPGAVDANGKPIPGAPPTSSITPPTMAQQQTNNRTLSQVGGGGTVRIQDPQTGLIHLIPQSDAAAAQQAGGRLV